MSVYEIDLHSSPTQIQTLITLNPSWGIEGKIIGVSKAGEGNMNVVLRLRLDTGQSLIIKQSRPFVNKYPAIPAPIERISVEYAFYKAIIPHPTLSNYMPKLIGYDPVRHLLAIEDLGEGSDYTYLYKRGMEWPGELSQHAFRFISILHQLTPPLDYPANLELRHLNAVHLFDYPYQNDHGFDLDRIQPGLQQLAQPYKHDQNLQESIGILRNQYLSPGQNLLHGDFYPGGWLQASSGFRVIDPEFSFIGPAEFDVGVMLAHLYLAHQNDEMILSLFHTYVQPQDFSETLCHQFCGVEIIRRLIGLAQLPVDLSLEEIEVLLNKAKGMVVSSGW